MAKGELHCLDVLRLVLLSLFLRVSSLPWPFATGFKKSCLKLSQFFQLPSAVLDFDGRCIMRWELWTPLGTHEMEHLKYIAQSFHKSQLTSDQSGRWCFPGVYVYPGSPRTIDSMCLYKRSVVLLFC